MSDVVATADCKVLATRIRAHALEMIHRAGSSHVGGCLSAADLLAVLYSGVLRVDASRPDWPDRDRLVVSKEHAAAAVYAALAERGFIPREWLEGFYLDGSPLPGHVTYGVPGVEASTGALGHGLSIACGMALAGKRDGRDYRVFVLLSDGELDEGSVWEAALFASHHHLDNLVAIIDYNKIQSFGSVRHVLDLEPLAHKWLAFGWAVKETNGHDVDQVEEALATLPLAAGRPGCVIAHTVKGKGVSFMENQLCWHYQRPDDRQLAQALAELGVSE